MTRGSASDKKNCSITTFHQGKANLWVYAPISRQQAERAEEVARAKGFPNFRERIGNIFKEYVEKQLPIDYAVLKGLPAPAAVAEVAESGKATGQIGASVPEVGKKATAKSAKVGGKGTRHRVSSRKEEGAKVGGGKKIKKKRVSAAANKNKQAGKEVGPDIGPEEFDEDLRIFDRVDDSDFPDPYADLESDDRFE